jgi:CheY-like chemotaxis protein
VDDLLDVSRVTQGRLAIAKEAVPVAVPVMLALDIVRPQFEARKQILAVDVPDEWIVVECDTARLAQSVANLLHNASKFTGEGGRIGLAVTREGGAMVLRVRDTGIGISASLLPRIFDVFVQGDQALDRLEGGLGLGLTISRRLVEMQGGTLEAASDGPGLGSEFMLRLPIATDRPAETKAPPLVYAGVPRRMLLVDDHADALEALERIMRLMGHDVRGALDGESALRVAAEFRPDMVVLDIGLPGMDGYEVARRLRALPGLEDVTLIALTGYGQHDDLERARQAGFDHHLLKPVLPEAVLALTRGAVVV